MGLENLFFANKCYSSRRCCCCCFKKTSVPIEESPRLQVDAYRFSRLSREVNESLKITMTKKRSTNAVWRQILKQTQMGCLREF